MNYIQQFIDQMDPQWLEENILNLYRLERKQNYPYYEKAARYVYDLLQKEGFESELLEFPADGKTVYQDKCCPIGWDITKGTLEVVSGAPSLNGSLICDYAREPLSVAKHSVSTPPEGISTRVVTESQMKAGEDVTGAFVLLNQSTRPTGAAIRMILDLGAIGWISDFHEEGINTDLDAVYWCNAATEYGTWSVIAEDRDYISYQVSPRVGFALREGCEKGTVIVHAYSNGRRYETSQYAITGLLPGEDSRELWVISHMYEPLIDDNANGVIGSIALLKALRQFAQEGKIKLKYSVRLVFASEMYGVAAVADHFGGDLSKRCIGAINTDGTTGSFDKSEHREYLIVEGPDLPGFVGNIFMQATCDKYLQMFPDFTLHQRDHGYGDDNFLGDATVGLPTVWFRHSNFGYHHHSTQDESLMDLQAGIEHLACHGDWIRSMVATTEEEVRELLPIAVERANAMLAKAASNTVRAGTDLSARMAFLLNREQEKIRGFYLYCNIPEIEAACKQIVVPEANNPQENGECPWYDYSKQFVFKRLEIGFPHDLMFLPKEKRFRLPGGVTYSSYADVLSRMDGVKSFQDILREVEWDLGIVFDEKTVIEYLRPTISLAQYGYLGMEVAKALTADDLAAALKDLGVKDGDTLLVHSAISKLGYVEGGADAVIEALTKAVGESGTFMAPAFARPYIYFEGHGNKAYTYRPYDTRPDGALRDISITTGLLPRTMLKYPESFRSGHVSHEWVALGAKAEYCVSGHDLLDDPASKNSPMAKALELDGSVVFLGCGVNPNTFIHFIEDMADAPFLHPALVTYLDEEGMTQSAYIRRHLGGCRDFYSGMKGKFYQEAIRRGLHIYQQPFGLATLYRIELRELYEIGMQIYREDPIGMLCGSSTCSCCQRYGRVKRK